MENKNNTKNIEAHGCQYCSKPCFGLQCKDCHIKMVAERAGVCMDCSKTFSAKRKDGSMRKRCMECQTKFASENITPCIDCSKPFPSKRKDGTTKKRCFECQDIFSKENFKKCDSCDKSTWKEYSFCKDCVSARAAKRDATMSVKSSSSGGSAKSHKCSTATCNNMTTYNSCSECHRNFRYAANEYMISTCQEDGCGYRGTGMFKYCAKHRK